jgi:predicted membrane protein DUF2306
MADNETIIAGIVIPSASPFFLAVVGLHILAALVCVITGVVAMLSNKRPGRHPTFGTAYYWGLSVVVLSATVLSAIRWAEDYHLFVFGVLSFAAASLGRTALRQCWRNWVRLHIAGMGTSYVFLLVAFYVDNGKNLPLWRELPPTTYWALPAALGVPLIIHALLRHPLAQRPTRERDAL